MRVRKHIFFSGQVQGVGFRYTAMYLARPLGLTGWVRNLMDGRVEMEAQGEEGDVELLLQRLAHDERYIVITDMEIRDVDPIDGETRFAARGYE